MYNPNLFQIILARVSKEYNCYNSLLSYYNNDTMLKAINNSFLHIGTRQSIKSILYYNPSLFKLVYFNEIIYKSINYILFSIIHNELKKFLIKHCAFDKFNKNIEKRKLVYYIGNSAHFIKNYDEYVTFAKNHNIDILNLIIDAFDWASSNNGFEFWKNLHAEYRIHLYKLLFNYEFKQN